jgi:single-stranded DNA-specific DHH superfamily exonuclease
MIGIGRANPFVQDTIDASAGAAADGQARKATQHAALAHIGAIGDVVDIDVGNRCFVPHT